MQVTATIPTPSELLEASAVTPEFRDAVLQFVSSQKTSPGIRFGPGNPPIKVLRVICGLLETFPDLAVRSVEVNATSGCSDYRGEVIVNGGERRYRFVWDCAWKAREAGWRDYFGEPDQGRAAKTFGYRCFEYFDEIK